MMKRILPILFSVVAVLTASAQVTNEFHSVRAAVVDVKPLQEFRGTVERTLTSDPRFALTLRIESIVPSLAGYTNSSLVSFAIHSPAEINLDGAYKTQTYWFVLSREVRDGVAGAWRFFARPTVNPSARFVTIATVAGFGSTAWEALEEAGIPVGAGDVHGGGHWDITVPEDKKSQAVAVLKKDAELHRYEVEFR